MNVKDGGPAFAQDVHVSRANGGVEITKFGGLSLRDYFAAQILPAVYTASLARGEDLQDTIAEEAYELADAMIEAREVKS